MERFFPHFPQSKYSGFWFQIPSQEILALGEDHNPQLRLKIYDKGNHCVTVRGSVRIAVFTTAESTQRTAKFSFGPDSRTGGPQFCRAYERRLDDKGGAQKDHPEFLYELWVQNNLLTAKRRRLIEEELNSFKSLPLISILMPVHDVQERWLRRAVESVRKQIYPCWQLCIVDDVSGKRHIRRVLVEYASSDKRIEVKFLSTRHHISVATNEAASLSKGEFVTFVDHDDELSEDALFEVAKLLQSHPSADVIYSDDDKIDEDGRRYSPQFKPDWSPELLLSYMYLGHIVVYRRSLFEEVGRLRPGYEGSQDYDLALRATECTAEIYHIPKVLYHWRSVPQSLAARGDSKDYSIEAGRMAVQDAVNRRGLCAAVVSPDFAIQSKLGIFKVCFRGLEKERVTIIIPTKDRVDLLAACIGSIEKKTTHCNYEILIVDSESSDATTLAYLSKTKHRVLRVENSGEGFNFSRLINMAVAEAETPYVLLLDNDTEVISQDWLQEMLGLMQIQGVAAVGAKLLFPDGTVQHAGVILGLNDGLAGHAFRRCPANYNGYQNYAAVARNCSAITGACLLTRRDYFLNVGGFDEAEFPLAYNDIDFCMKLLERSLRCVYTPHALLYHREEGCRGFPDLQKTEWALRRKYSQHDKRYNPNLSLDSETFEIDPFRAPYIVRCQSSKMLFIGHRFDLTGAPIFQFDLAVAMAKRGHTVKVLAPEDGPVRQQYEREGLEVATVARPYGCGETFATYKEKVSDLAETLHKEHFDVVHGNTLESFWAVTIAQKLNVPAVWNIHESVSLREYFAHYAPEFLQAVSQSFDQAFRVIFPAHATARVFGSFRKKGNFQVIRNGLSADKIEQYKQAVSREEAKRMFGFDQCAKVILLVGTICPRKGQLVLAEAAKQLLTHGRRNAYFLLVGGGEVEYLERVQNFISTNGLEKHIRLFLEPPDVFPYYRAADLFVCASFGEAFPRVTQEAAAFELPIVATNVFGLPEQIRQGITGILVEPGNPTELARGMEVVLESDDLARSLARNAYYDLLGRFSFERMIDRYEKVFQAAATF